jgi:Flp pilus assembly protein protease CpaA
MEIIILNQIFYIAVIVSIAGLITATYTDLKERIVPNKLNYGLAIAGLILFLIQSILQSSPLPFIYSFFGMCTGFFFGWIMWKAGIFAGGDVKLFMGLGALNPFTPALLKIGILTNSSTPLFPITLFIYSLFAFLPYGIFVVIAKLAKNKKMQKEIFNEMKPKILLSIHASIFTSAMYTVLTVFAINSLLIIPLLMVWGFFRNSKKYLTIISFAVALLLNYQLLTASLITTILISTVFYSLIKLLFSVKRVLVSEVYVKKLEEGMIPAKTLIWKGKKVVELEGINVKLLMKSFKEKNTADLMQLLFPKREIISASKARGINDEELKIVKQLAQKGLIPKKMMIKESMPFVPTMFLGYILCLALGDAIFILLGGI